MMGVVFLTRGSEYMNIQKVYIISRGKLTYPKDQLGPSNGRGPEPV